MLNRFTRGAVAVAGALLTFGAVSTMMAGAAGAGVITNTSGIAGYVAGNGSYSFRYATTTFSVPEYACVSDDFVAGGIELVGSLGSTHDNAVIGVHCIGHTPWVYWSTTSLTHLASGGLIVSDDDNVTVSVYYDATTGYDYFYVTDNTSGASDSWAHKAGVAEYHYDYNVAVVNDPLHYPPPPGSNYALVTFTNSGLTTYSGVHGTGLNGPWGYNELEAVNGAHVVAAAPVLYNGYSTFNVRIYGNG